MAFDRLGRLISKAGDLAQQVNQEYQRSRQAQEEYREQQFRQYEQQRREQRYQTQPPIPPPYRQPQPQPQSQSQSHSTPSEPPYQQSPAAPDWRTMAAQYQAETDRELRKAMEEGERVKRENEAAIKLAEREMARLRADQEEQMRLAEEQLRRLRVEDDQGGRPSREQQQMQYAYEIPPPPPRRPEATPTMSAPASPDVVGPGRVDVRQPQQSVYYPPPRPRSPAVAAVPLQQASYTPYDGSSEVNANLQAPIQPQTQHQTPPQVKPEPPQPPQSSSLPRSNTPPPQQPHPCGITPLTECVEDPMNIEVDFFVHPAAPNFTTCSRCYVDHIYNTPFRETFRLTKFTEKQPRKCHFGSQRMKQLWPTAVSSGNLTPVVEFMQRRQGVPNCAQTGLKEGASWYTTPEIPNAAFCQACFEDVLMLNPFGARFRLETVQGTCFCDLSSRYVKRMFKIHSTTNNWSAFAAEVRKRVEVSPCPKLQAVKPAERSWFVSKKGPEGLQICGACYWDYFHGTEDQGSFSPVAPKADKVACMMGYVNLLFPAIQASSKEDQSIFWAGISGVDKNPFCSPTGTKGATWYTLPNDPPNFGICGGCYEGIIRTLGGSRYFHAKPPVPPEEAYLCCFNAGHHRMPAYMQNYAETLLKGTIQPLKDYATAFATVPPCPRHDMKKGADRKYWGWPNAQICEDCYLSFAKNTPFEAHYTLHGEVITGPSICDLYSSRMRRLYNTNPLDSFLSAAQHRRQIFQETVPRMEQLLVQQKMTAQMAHMQGVMGTTYRAMGGAAAAVQHTGYTVGNVYGGYGWRNEMELDGAMYSRMSRETVGGAMGAVAEVRMLEGMWRAVE